MGPSNTAGWDFTHTVQWGGAGPVVDQSSQVNPNFTISSQSGFNCSAPFTTAVPEPVSLRLAALAWKKRRR